MAFISIGTIVQGLAKAPRGPMLTQNINDNCGKRETVFFVVIICIYVVKSLQYLCLVVDKLNDIKLNISRSRFVPDGRVFVTRTEIHIVTNYSKYLSLGHKSVFVSSRGEI